MPKKKRPNRERANATQAALLEAARRLFVDHGFAETGTPEIVAAAGVTRGALYHHFAGKQALFRSVVERESMQVASEIEKRSADGSALEMLMQGGRVFLAAMSAHGRTRLLLLDGPAVLGHSAMDAIDAAGAGRTLREGLAQAIEHGEIIPLPLDAAAALLGAAFDRAALFIENGGNAEEAERVVEALIDGLRPKKAPLR